MVSSPFTDVEIRDAAYRIAQGLRSLFNKPEIVALIRSGDDESYWRAVLDHSVDGCLQAVLDEYAHVLVESEGLQDADHHRALRLLSETMVEALSIRTATNTVEQVSVAGSEIHLEEHRINSHLAARYGRAQSNDQAALRESTIRTGLQLTVPAVRARLDVRRPRRSRLPHLQPRDRALEPPEQSRRSGAARGARPPLQGARGQEERRRRATAAPRLTRRLTIHGTAMFDAAVDARAADDSDIKPFWIFTRPDGAVIETIRPSAPAEPGGSAVPTTTAHGRRVPGRDRAAAAGRPDPIRRRGRRSG